MCPVVQRLWNLVGRWSKLIKRALTSAKLHNNTRYLWKYRGGTLLPHNAHTWILTSFCEFILLLEVLPIWVHTPVFVKNDAVVMYLTNKRAFTSYLTSIWFISLVISVEATIYTLLSARRVMINVIIYIYISIYCHAMLLHLTTDTYLYNCVPHPAMLTYMSALSVLKTPPSDAL